MLSHFYWQHIMVEAVRSVKLPCRSEISDGDNYICGPIILMHISPIEINRLTASIYKPIPDQIEPFDAFCSYVFEKANEEAEKEIAQWS